MTALCWFPELDRLALGILELREASHALVGLGFRDLDLRRAELRDHRGHVPHSEVEFPLLRHVAEVLGVGLEGREGGDARLLSPGLAVGSLRNGTDAKVALVPFRERLRV